MQDWWILRISAYAVPPAPSVAAGIRIHVNAGAREQRGSDHKSGDQKLMAGCLLE